MANTYIQDSDGKTIQDPDGKPLVDSGAQSKPDTMVASGTVEPADAASIIMSAPEGLAVTADPPRSATLDQTLGATTVTATAAIGVAHGSSSAEGQSAQSPPLSADTPPDPDPTTAPRSAAGEGGPGNGAQGVGGRPADRAPSWIFFQYPQEGDRAWTLPFAPGAMIFWPLDPEKLGFGPDDRLVENATVILDVDQVFVAVGLLAAGDDMRFLTPDGRRWWPIMLVEIVENRKLPPGLLSVVLRQVYGRGEAAPIQLEEWLAVQDALSNAKIEFERQLPINVPSALSLRSLGQTLRDGLARRDDVTPDPATRARLEATGQSDRLPKVFNDRAETRDLLDIGSDVSAFARLAIARGIDPPLSVGVFGDWGSGKSFFMDQVSRRIDRIAKDATDDKHPASKAYHADVPQIRFNAWHYIETNLWASLVEYIFTELDAWLTQKNADPAQVGALFDQLSTSRQLKLEAFRELLQARREKKKADDKVTDARSTYQAALKRPLSHAEVWRATADTFIEKLTQKDKDELNAAAKGFGIEDVDKARQAAAKVIEDTASQGERARMTVGAIMTSAGTGGGIVVIVGSLLAPAALVALIVWSLNLPSAKAISGILVATAGTISGLTLWLRSAVSLVKPQLDTLDRLRKALADKVEIATADERAAVENADKAAGLAAKALAAAEQQARSAADKVTAIELEQVALTGSGRLNRFIREKATNGDYARHLGIIASVHKDFAQLSRLLRDQNGNVDSQDSAKAAYVAASEALLAEAEAEDLEFGPKEREQLQETAALTPPAQKIGRIVLYIDDLDRCPPEKVVEVLQAIHMFLYFPLFVVFVAVDARWLKRSLQVRYRRLISSGGNAGGEAAADPQDYLEKIFQIPFWVDPMTELEGQQFVDGLTLDLAPRSGATSGTGATGLSATAVAEAAAEASAGPATQEAGGAGSRWLGPSPPQQIALTLSEQERRALKAFGGLLGGSPRRTKRFVNTYLLIRMAQRVGEPTPVDQSVWPIVSMVALVVGARTVARAFLEVALEESAPEQLNKFKAAVVDRLESRSPDVAPSDRARLDQVFVTMETHPAAFNPGLLQRFAQDVGRFSF